MKNVIILLLLVISTTVSATNYYVSTSGNDASNGLSESTAWKTIAKINGTSFSPGDAILFKRGEVWRETLTVPSSGNSGSYILYSSYGSGVNPRIVGSTKAITWTSAGTNIWKSATPISANPFTDAQPAEIFFEDASGLKSWGTYVSGTSAITSEFKWTWLSGSIYVYATSDPGTKYSSVEIPVRESGVNMNKKNYIRFDGIDILFAKHSGYGYDWTHNNMFEQFGLIIENSEIACGGAWEPALETGYGIEVVYSDMIVRKNKVHDFGRRSFAMDMYGNSYTARKILVEGNDFYNGFHTTGLDIDAGAGYNASLDNIIIRNNFFHETSATRSYDLSNLIFIQNNNTASCTITNVYIYNNTFKWANGYGILMENAQSVFIYNNVFYDKNANASWAPFVSVQGSSVATVKNNIFYRSTTGSSTELEKNTTTTNDYNLYFNTTVSGSETHGVFSKNPLFLAAANNDFHLSTGSPAIGAGVAIAEVSTDADGKTYTNPPSVGVYSSLTSVIVATNPVYVSSVIQNSTPTLLELTYNLALANLVPAATAFSVMVNSVAKTVSNVVISGTKVQLILASPLLSTDVVKVSYTKPATNPLQTSAGGFAASISGMTVVNSITAPAKDATATTIKMTLTPNPAHSIINCLFVYSANFSATTPAMSPQVIKIFNNSGKLYVQKSLTTGIAKIGIPINLKSGIYKVVLSSGTAEMSSQKIVVY